MKRLGYEMKRFTAMFLSACMVLQQGAMSTWAAESAAGAETASASDASAAGGSAAGKTGNDAASAASASDALYDEDGLLIDGAVADDVTAMPEGEVIEAPEMNTEVIKAPEMNTEVIKAPEVKTEVIAPELAADEWLDDFDYTVSGNRLLLMDYTGSDATVFINSVADHNGVIYSVAIGENLFESNKLVEEIYFASNVIFPADCSAVFSGCSNLRIVDMNNCDLSEVTSMRGMFFRCSHLAGVYFGNHDTSKLTDMGYMFWECYDLHSVNLTGLNMSGVTKMDGMFYDCSSLEAVTVPDGFMSGAEDVSDMFFRCSMLTEFDLTCCDLSNVTDMSGMFQYCTGLKWMSMEGLNTSSVKYMSDTFAECTSLEELDMTGADLSSVISADRMLSGCDSLESIYVPERLAVDVELPRTMYTSAGVGYDSIPMNASGSFHIADTQSVVMVTGIIINTEQRTVMPGEYFQLKAWPQPANATNREVIWTSEDPSAVFVDSYGLVYTSGESGTVRILATTKDGGYTASCNITIGVPVTSVKINTTERTIAKGSTFRMAAWPQPVNAANKEVTWSSSNPAVAAVDSTGLVTAVKAGTADITVKTKDGGKTATCRITVNVPVTSVKINTTAKTMTAGTTFQMAAWPQPADATNKAVTWTSSNSAVAKVSSTGLVTAVKAGTATITVKTADGGFTAVCKITVKAATVPVTSVKINTTARTLEVGKTFQLAAWPQPTNATNKKVTWHSFNASVATVSSTGLVTAKGKGSTNVRVMTEDGGKIAYCKITVKEASAPTVPVTSVKINTTAKTLEVGKTFQLAAWPQPTNATNKNVTWTSSNSAVAKVSSTGLVTAVKAGTATITVKTADGGKTATCKITVQNPAVIPPGYQVSAPTNVHWTDNFKMAFAVGRTADGEAYPGYSITIYEAVTGTALEVGYGNLGDLDQSEILIGPKTVEKMVTGSYYFKIYAADEDWNQIGPEAQSEIKTYTRPNERIPAPSNLRWQGKKLLYDYPEDSRQYTENMRINVLYSATEGGTFRSKRNSMIYNSELYAYLERNLTEPGYYKVTIQMLTSDPQLRLSTLEVVESPVCHVTQ